MSSWFLFAQESREIENVASFARLYGVVRFFYPSDAAAAADWDRLTIEGVARVRHSPDAAVLADRLRESFAGLGPGIEIARDLPEYSPPGPTTEPLVAWRYLGPGATQFNPYVGKRTNRARGAAGLAPGDQPASANELFPDAPPAIRDHVDVDLGSGLNARVPLTLTDAQAKAGAVVSDRARSTTSARDERIADIVVAWNFYRHFYPYLADTGVDWDARLRPQLQRALSAADRSGEADALRRLVADAHDGHGRVNDIRQPLRVSSLPLRLALVDSRLVVVASRATDVPVGSIVSTIDGIAGMDRFSVAMQTVSGSDQWRQWRAANEIAICTTGSTARLGIDTVGGPRTVVLACTAAGLAPLDDQRPAQIAELTPGIWYVDLTRAKNADLIPVVATLAAANGVIFDLRGYPTESGAWVLPHLIETVEHDRWMHIAKITGPFGQSAGWQDFGWDLKPAEPKFSGKIVFLTDGRAISYAESVMGYIRDRHLATIVGGTTAGTNGNIARFQVPGGFHIIFTGMRVTGHDGRAVHHLIGVRPDILVAPTIAGVRDGRDEVLARALSLFQ